MTKKKTCSIVNCDEPINQSGNFAKPFKFVVSVSVPKVIS